MALPGTPRRMLRRPGFLFIALFGLSGPALPQAASVTFHIVIEETHDRLTPTPKPGIIKRHEFTVVLRPNKQIYETWQQADVTRRFHADPGGERSTMMGENNGKSVWRVLGDSKLRRIAANNETLIIWDIQVSSDKTCAIDVKYLLKAGVTYTTGKIAGTDIDATFNNFRVLKATCTIE